MIAYNRGTFKGSLGGGVRQGLGTLILFKTRIFFHDFDLICFAYKSIFQVTSMNEILIKKIVSNTHENCALPRFTSCSRRLV